MFPTDNEIIQEISLIKGSEKSTIKGYKFAVKYYTECHNLSLQELLTEAEKEENELIPLRNRSIKKRLISFQRYLITKGLAVSTVNIYMVKIKSIYHFYDFELPNITKLKNTTFKNITDIPSLDDVKLAIENTNNIKLQAMILFAVSSGCGRKEILSLTVKMFIDATNDYHNSTNIVDVIDILLSKDDTIPLFSLLRQKTNKQYYCCCSTEAVKKICVMLKERIIKGERLYNNSKVFNFTDSYVSSMFEHLNDKLGFGYVNHFRYFRLHSLRMRFQTELAKAHLDPNYYEHMVGHKLNPVQEAYIQIDPEVVREQYKKVVYNLCVYDKVNYIEIESDDRKELMFLREELKQIKQKLAEYGYN